VDKLSDRLMDKARGVRGAAGSIGIAFAAIFMVSVITFGATSIRPMTADRQPDGAAAAAQQDPASPEADGPALGNGSLDGPREGPKDGPATEPDVMDGKEGDEHPWQPPKDGAEEPTDEPAPTEEPKHEEPAPTEKPYEPDPTKPPQETGTLGLEAWTKEGHVKLAWSKYGGDGFEYYKVVRSKDATVKWPLGEGDELVGVIGDRFSPWFADSAPCGTEWHYRVFAVRHTEDGYKVLAASNVAGAYLACDEPPADPVKLAFEVKQVDGGVKLTWEQCSSGDFVAYKVVRSKVHDNPTFPLNDGTQLIAVFENHEVTAFKDTDVAAGQTWTYRVYSMARNGDGGWVVLGLTAARTITVS
jgi:hypothetical protein